MARQSSAPIQALCTACLKCNHSAQIISQKHKTEVGYNKLQLSTLSCEKFHLSLLGSLTSRRTWRHLAATVGTSRKQGVQ
jgi:hypothetical protein